MGDAVSSVMLFSRIVSDRHKAQFHILSSGLKESRLVSAPYLLKRVMQPVIA